MINLEDYLDRYNSDEENEENHDILGYDPNSTARDQLPVFKERLKILYLTKQSDVLILSAESGSGKTTQIPQHLLAFNYANVKLIKEFI
jgi:HrpA-like RNA helicase